MIGLKKKRTKAGNGVVTSSDITSQGNYSEGVPRR